MSWCPEKGIAREEKFSGYTLNSKGRLTARVLIIASREELGAFKFPAFKTENKTKHKTKQTWGFSVIPWLWDNEHPLFSRRS